MDYTDTPFSHSRFGPSVSDERAARGAAAHAPKPPSTRQSRSYLCVHWYGDEEIVNMLKHEITFDDALRVFLDPNRIRLRYRKVLNHDVDHYTRSPPGDRRDSSPDYPTDLDALLPEDKDSDADRHWVTLGVSNGRLLAVAYTQKSEGHLLMSSARRADSLEQDTYVRAHDDALTPHTPSPHALAEAVPAKKFPTRSTSIRPAST